MKDGEFASFPVDPLRPSAVVPRTACCGSGVAIEGSSWLQWVDAERLGDDGDHGFDRPTVNNRSI